MQGKASAEISDFSSPDLQVGKTRLLLLGESIGLASDDGRDPRLDSPMFQPVIERALNYICLYLTEARDFPNRYGLDESKKAQAR